MDNGLVAAELAADEVGELLDGGAGNFNVGRRAGSGVRGGFGELLGGKLTAVGGVLDESEGVGDVADDGVRASNRQGPDKLLVIWNLKTGIAAESTYLRAAK